MGGGKTRTACEVLKRLDAFSKPGEPVLIFARPKGTYHWVNELLTWTDLCRDDIRIARGDPASRDLIWRQAKKFKVIITTYDTGLRDKNQLVAHHWWAVVGDESHRLRNRKVKAFKLLKAMRYNIFLPLSGSQMRNGPQDMWTLFHLCDKRTFSSYWKFCNAFVEVVDGDFGKEFLGPRNVARFQKLLDQRAAVVGEDEVDDALPEKAKHRLYVELEGAQKRLYEQLENDLLVELDSGGIVVSQNEMVQLIRLRQCLVCPQILDSSQGPGNALEAVVEHSEDEPHFVVFTSFAKALPIWKEWLKKKGYRVNTIYGGMKDREVQDAAEDFDKRGGVLLSTIAVAESWQVTTASKAYFIHYEWAPDINAQAEDRLRRITSEHRHINYYYVYHVNTVDEDVLDAVNFRHRNVQRALYSPERLKELVRSRSKFKGNS